MNASSFRKRVVKANWWRNIYYPLVNTHTTIEGPVRIKYKCLVSIYVFPEMKMRGLVISKS